jgi:Plasmid encoded RepA protein
MNDTDALSLDLFGRPLPPAVRRVVNAGGEIMQAPPDRADFLHAVLCQVGMPRRATPGRVFERASGTASMSLEAGRLWTGTQWRELPLPYGSRPRLVMVHVSSEAVRTRSREIHIGESMRDFLHTLGIDSNGGARGGYAMFKKQMEALAACRLMLGFTTVDRVVTMDTKPIRRFEAWLQNSGEQQPLWPGLLELSQDYFDTLVTHAVPLDPRALAGLKHSALALDVYSWLAHRLCRVRTLDGTKVSWANLRDQFGQEYANPKDFKREFRSALRSALAVYPDARVEEIPGGLLLRPSPPPLPKIQVQVTGQ